MTALVLFAGYLLLVIGAVLMTAREFGLSRPSLEDPLLKALLAANLVAFVWRAAARFVFTAHEYGWREGLRAIGRIPVANVIAIMAGRRALAAYVAVLLGAKQRWDKTLHLAHPAAPGPRPAG